MFPFILMKSVYLYQPVAPMQRIMNTVYECGCWQPVVTGQVTLQAEAMRFPAEEGEPVELAC